MPDFVFLLHAWRRFDNATTRLPDDPSPEKAP